MYLVIAYNYDPKLLDIKLMCPDVETILDKFFYSHNLMDHMGFVNSLTYMTDYENMSLLVDLSFKKSYFEYKKIYFKILIYTNQLEII
jgi:hypothetical protein